MLITPGMVVKARERLRQSREGIPVVACESDCPKLSTRVRQRMQDRGLRFALPPDPLTVVMEDEITHTPSFPVCADDANCCCYKHEREKIIAETTPKRRRRGKILISATYEPSRADTASLNGNRGFNLLK